ncbi:hypothetical protein [Methanosphaera sp.]|jgi:hypothetical protein|uniref:hypothetical protein n=1 Tax=Methanosphaera sp. TaxID=2666342 RepID=UPI003D8ABD5C
MFTFIRKMFKKNTHNCKNCDECNHCNDLINDLPHINSQKYYEQFDEYPEFIKQYQKLTRSNNIFDSFTEKIKNQHGITNETIDEIITLNTLAQGVIDDHFREFLYQKIIDELIIYCFISRK